jgi:hypothetical protein
MILVILAIVLTICITFFGWSLLKLSKSIQYLLSLSEAHQRNITLGRELTRQVDEIHQTMGGVINSLQAMGHQVYNLNMLAQGAQMQPMHQQPQIMIEIRPNRTHPEEEMSFNPEEMPPEMLEKFQVFQSIYQRIVTSPKPLPSSSTPEMN